MERERQLGNYILRQTIGQGTFGKVKLATHRPSGESVAVKVLEKAKIAEVADVERVAHEIHILKLVRHPHIIHLYEIIETGKYLFLVMEFVEGGELFARVAGRGLSEANAKTLFRQLLSGVDYLHRLNVAHRDLKP